MELLWLLAGVLAILGLGAIHAPAGMTIGAAALFGWAWNNARKSKAKRARHLRKLRRSAARDDEDDDNDE